MNKFSTVTKRRNLAIDCEGELTVGEIWHLVPGDFVAKSRAT